MAKSTSDQPSFEGTRGGVRHRYRVCDETLAYCATAKGGEAHPKEFEIPWRDIVRLRPGPNESLYFVRSSGQELGVWLDSKEMQAFLPLAIAAWGKHSKEAARKSAFDYGASEPAVGWIWLVLSFGFPGLLALMLLSDGYHELNCNKLLEHGSVAAAQVVKIKKNRRGNFLWTLEYTTPNGEKFTGKREVPFKQDQPISHGVGKVDDQPGPAGAPRINDKGEPLGSKNDVTIIFSPERPACWDLSMKQNEAALNRTQRHFVVLLDLSFGWLFALVGVVGTGLSIARIRRKHPYRDVVRLAGAELK